LDLATGTADVAIDLAASGAARRVVGIDPSAEMLAIGRRKLPARYVDSVVQLAQGAAESLPFDDGRFDAVTMAFGIRNVADRPRALAEMVRVTRSGGRLVILELGEPDIGPLAPLARMHVRHVVPRLGGWLSGEDEYRYLAASIAAFPKPPWFAELLRQAGADFVDIRRFALGAANLFTAVVP